MLQTVIEIALGIVLAVLILRFLTGILKVGLVLIALVFFGYGWSQKRKKF